MTDRNEEAPFSAQVLDDLNLNKRAPETSARTTGQLSSSVQLPPSFDSFPDLSIPAAPHPAWNIPSFSSFPVETPSFRISSSPREDISKKSKKEKRTHGHDRPREDKDDKNSEVRTKRSSDDRRDDSRERRKYLKSNRADSDSRDRDRVRDNDRENKDSENRDREYRHREDKDRGKNKASRSRGEDEAGGRERRDLDRSDRNSGRSAMRDRSSRRDSSRDKRHSDPRHNDPSERRHEGSGTSRGQDHLPSHSGRNGPGRSRNSSKSPDRKKSRLEKFERTEGEDRWSTRRDRDRDRDREFGIKSVFPSAPKSPAPWRSNKPVGTVEPGEQWIIDVKGDQDFVRYGGINPLTVPRYYRAGDGRVLGMPREMRIDFQKTNALGGRTIVFRTPGSRTKPVRYIDPHATWRDQSKEYKRISRVKAEELARSSDPRHESPSFVSLDIRSGNRSERSDDSNSEDSNNNSDDDGAATVSGRKRVDYRDIHGKSVHQDEDEDLLQTRSDQEEEGAESALDVLMRRRMMLDSELRRDPRQPHKWLEFIGVEDEIDLVSTRRSAASVAAHSTSHAEVKLSIFERALLSNPTNEHLLLEYMNTCRQCWEPAKVLSKWDELLQSTKIQTAWPGLWIEYLDFRQRHFLSFSVRSFTRVLEDALERLGRLARSTWMALQRATAENSELKMQLIKIESVMVHVIARSWMFLKQAGYVERAQGIIQGQVEFLFDMPPSLVTEPWAVQIGSLEEYWDSELPRFGEKGARGWTHYVTEEDEVAMDHPLDHTRLPSTEAPTDELIRAFAENNVDRYHYTRWAKLEKELNTLCWFPIRTTEDLPDQLEDDPYGIIIFDDIRPFIVFLHTQEAREEYIESMFCFLGLPMNSLVGSNRQSTLAPLSSSTPNSGLIRAKTSSGLYNPFFHDSLLLNIGIEIQSTLDATAGLRRFFPEFETKDKQVERILKEIESEQELREPEERDWACVWTMPVRLFPQSTDTIYGVLASEEFGRKLVTPYPWAAVSSPEEIQISNKCFIRNALQQLTEVVPISKIQQRNLSLYHLMYEVLDTMSASKSQKLAKKYLKDDRMDLELWNAYAQAEQALDRISEARKVYSTALSMYRSFPAENQARAPLIYRYYAELEWKQDRPGVALAILLAYAESGSADIPEDDHEDVSMPTPTRLIKAHQFYAQKVAQLSMSRPSVSLTPSDATVGGKWFEPAVDMIVCFSLFEYLSSSAGSDGGLQSGVKVFESAVQELDFRNPDSEIDVPKDAPKGQRGAQYQKLVFSSLSVSTDLLRAERTTTRKKICTSVEAEMLWVQLAKLAYVHSLKAMSASNRRTPPKANRSQSHSHSQSQGNSSHANGGGAGFQPGELRRIVHAGLERFPNCTILQSLFFWTEAKLRIYGRVRTWVNEHVGQGLAQGAVSRPGGVGGSGPLASKAPMWIFGLFYELWNQEPYNPHMARSLLESALESSRSSSFSSSPNLWLVYIELELRESARQRDSAAASPLASKGASKDKGKVKSMDKGKDEVKGKNLDRAGLRAESSTRVKQLMMRALNDCPWYKDLYMLAFEPRMRDLFSIEELDQLYQTMLEKEIRVRIDIPEREMPRPRVDERQLPAALGS